MLNVSVFKKSFIEYLPNSKQMKHEKHIKIQITYLKIHDAWSRTTIYTWKQR